MPVAKTKGPVRKVAPRREPVYLKFLVDFMNRMNLSIPALAAKLGISRQSVSYWFVRDDASLSRIQETFDVLGYDIRFSYVPLNPAPQDVDVVMEVGRTEKYIFGPRLEFLNRAIRCWNINKVQISRDMNIGGTTIYYWQSHDDCLISNLVEFGKAAGLKLDIRIAPKDPAGEETVIYDDTADRVDRGEEIRRNLQMVRYQFSQFLSDVDGLMEGHTRKGPRARRGTRLMEDLLKEYRRLSVQFDKSGE